MNTNFLPSIRLSGTRSFAPPQTAFTRTFWDALREHRFLTTRCDTCARMTFPPKPFCPHCWGRNVQWTDLRTQGIVYSATTVHATPKVFQGETPYAVGIVDLADNIRIATRVLHEGSVQDVIGAPCELIVTEYEDGPLYAARVLHEESRGTV